MTSTRIWSGLAMVRFGVAGYTGVGEGGRG